MPRKEKIIETKNILTKKIEIKYIAELSFAILYNFGKTKDKKSFSMWINDMMYMSETPPTIYGKGSQPIAPENYQVINDTFYMLVCDYADMFFEKNFKMEKRDFGRIILKVRESMTNIKYY